MQQKHWTLTVLAMLLIFILSACVQATGDAPGPETAADTDETVLEGEEPGVSEVAECEEYDDVVLQLKWVAQAQFAGYYAAEDQGYYAEECIDITIQPGGPDIVPEQVVASGQADFGVNFVPSLLSAREQGTNLVNVAQIFQGSAMREIAWADSGIDSPDDLAGKRVAVWLGGNEFELLATLRKYGLDPETDLELIQQPFDMNLFLQRQVDAAAAMTYNELAQVLETVNPETGELYQLDDLNVIDFNEEDTAMLQDGLFTTTDYLNSEENQDIAERFLRASFKGWIYCRENPESCVDAVLQRGPALPRGHQTWMMNEINKLIWPSEAGIGIMQEDLFQQTADIALEFGVIETPASAEAYTTQYAEAALDGIEMNTVGADWEPMTVELTEGGQ